MWPLILVFAQLLCVLIVASGKASSKTEVNLSILSVVLCSIVVGVGSL